MLLQMPIFMGLYYALQESITSAWRVLADMDRQPGRSGHDIRVGQKIPLISSPAAYGGLRSVPGAVPEPAADHRGDADDLCNKS